MFILKSKIKPYVEKHKAKTKLETEKVYEEKIKQIKADHKIELMLAEKDYEIELSELRQLISYYKKREKYLSTQQNQIIRERAALQEASSKLYVQMNMIGETIMKGGKECQGVFEKIDTLIQEKKRIE